MAPRRRRPDLQALAETIDSIYGAALEPDGWQNALAQVTHLLGGHGGLIQSTAVSPEAGGLWVGHNVPEAKIPGYLAHYYHKDLWRLAGDRLRDLGVASSDMLVDPRTFERSEFWNEFLREMDFFHLSGSIPVMASDGSPETKISVFRGRRRAGFDATDMRLHRLLVPHLRRAFQLHWRLRWLTARAEGAIGALDQVQISIFLVDRDARIVHANQAAERLVALDDGLIVRAGRLVATATDADIAAALAAALAPRRTRREHPASTTMAVKRRRDGPALVATIVPIGAASSLARMPQVAAAVFVTDPARRTRLVPDHIARLYGITRAEARLINALPFASSLKDAAATLGVSFNTARSQLKSAMAKTGSHRQVDLLAVLLQASGHLQHD